MTDDDGVPADGDGATDDQPTDDQPTDEEPSGDRTTDEPSTAASGAREQAVIREELEELQDRLESFESEIDERTVHRSEVERELKRYVRRRQRRGRARGWGPYLVLLYGTIMTLGAFYLLDGGWAVGAMLIVWLSTLGLYTLMVIVGMTFTTLQVPRRLLERLKDSR